MSRSASDPEQVARQRTAALAVWRADVETRPGGAWTDLGGLQLHTTGLPPVYWNGAHLYDASGLERLGEATPWFADRGVSWGLLVPAELGLAPPGFAPVVDQAVMLRDLLALPALPDVHLDWEATVDEVAFLQATVFDTALPLATQFVGPKLIDGPCSVVVARVDGLAVATATGVLLDGVVGVYGVGTLVPARRQGLGRAVTLAVLHRARDEGADLAFLNPSELGYAVYRSLGFDDAPPWQIWTPT